MFFSISKIDAEKTLGFLGTILLTAIFLQTAAIPVFAGAASTASSGKAAVKSITEEGIGCGATKREALRDAMKCAIEKAVGAYVTTKTELKNEDLSERIIVASDAVVTDYEELSCWEKDGTWMVRIKANVLPNEYLKYCPVETTLDVSREIGNVLNTVDTLRKADLILNEIFEDHLLKILKFRKTSFRTGSNMDLDNRKLSLEIDFDITVDGNELRKFKSRLCAFLDQIARNKATYTIPDDVINLRWSTDTDWQTIRNDWGKYFDTVWKKSGLDISEERDYRYILFEFVENGRKKVTFYLVRKDIYDLFLKNISNRRWDGENLVMTISFSMKDGTESRKTFFVNSHYVYRQFEYHSQNKNLIFYDEDDIYYSLKESAGPYTSDKLPLKGSVTFSDVPIDFVRNIKDLFIYPFVKGENDTLETFVKKADAIERKFWHVRER